MKNSLNFIKKNAWKRAEKVNIPIKILIIACSRYTLAHLLGKCSLTFKVALHYMTMCLTIKAALQSRSMIYSIIYEFISKIKRESLLGIGLFNKQSKVLIFSTLPIFCIKMLNSTPLIFNWAPTYIFKRESNSWFSFPIWKNMYK